jgi:RND family efflux transporter MFP subunit
LELDWLVNIMNARFCRSRIHVSVCLIAVAGLLSCVPGCKSNESAATVRASEARPAPAPPAPANDPSPAASAPAPFTAYGPLVAERQADVGAQRTGRVAAVAVNIGDRVKTGQVLAQLDDALLRAKYDAQKARLSGAQAALHDWQLEELMVTADKNRADRLREAKVISEEVWEHAKYKLDETIEGRAKFQNDVAVAEGELAAVKVQLDESQITAPFDGIVGRVSVRADQVVKEGDVLFWVTAEGPLQVLFTVPESAMTQFSTGTALELTTADDPGLRQRGHVLRLSPVVDPSSASLQVIGALDHPSPHLKPGMSMQVRLAP